MPAGSEPSVVRRLPTRGSDVEKETAPLLAVGAPILAVGTKVDVRTRFLGTWGHGFEVAEPIEGGYRVRRCSDGSVLPGVVPYHEIAPERPTPPSW